MSNSLQNYKHQSRAQPKTTRQSLRGNLKRWTRKALFWRMPPDNVVGGHDSSQSLASTCVGFSSLPMEIVIPILRLTVTNDWNLVLHEDERNRDNVSDSIWQLLDMRRVSKVFHLVISQELLRKSNQQEMRAAMGTMKEEVIASFFEAKFSMGPKHAVYPFEVAQTSWKTMAAWAGYSGLSVDQASYTRKLLEAICAFQGPKKLCQSLYQEVKTADDQAMQDKPWCADALSGQLRLVSEGCMVVAAFAGRIDLVRALIEYGVDPATCHPHLGTPLYAAACNGHTDIVRLLLPLDAPAGKSFAGRGGYPIEIATTNGHDDIVKYLVMKGVDTRYTLPNAIVTKNHSLAIYLIDKSEKIDINHGRDRNSSPILLAITGECEDVAVHLCKQHNLDVHRTTSCNSTALHLAVQNRQARVVRAIVSCDATATEEVNAWGHTPLHLACVSGYTDMVHALLEFETVERNVLDSRGGTPLTVALIHGWRPIVRLLLRDPETNAKTGKGEFIPMLAAVQSGDVCAVRMLVERAEIRSCSTTEERAFLCAIRCRHLHVMQFLLSVYRPNLGRANSYGRTLFHLAILENAVDIARLLLKQGPLDVTAKCYGDPALILAVRADSEEIIELLLAEDRIDVNVRGVGGTAVCGGSRPASDAAAGPRSWLDHVDPRIQTENHYCYTIDLIRNEQTVHSGQDEPNQPYKARTVYRRAQPGDTPLIWAARCGCLSIVSQLMRHRSIDPNLADGMGRTALMWAFLERGDAGAEEVKTILQHADTDPNAADDAGWTPLLLATFFNYRRVAFMLLAHQKTDPSAPNKDGWAPLRLAVVLRHHDIASRIFSDPRAYA